MESGDLKSIQMLARLKSSPSQSPPNEEEMIYVQVPGSKSITNRILLIAVLGKGTVRIRNLLKSADTIAMLEAMTKLQIATFQYDENSSEDNVLIVHGNGGTVPGTSKLKDNILHVNNSGTAARFLTTLAVVMAGKYKQPIHVTGNEQIKKRPIDQLVDALTANGCDIQYEENVGTLPLSVQKFEGLAGGQIKLDAQISSQYVSSILMCAPYANEPVTLELCGHIISKSYIDMTIALMKSFGIQVTQTGHNIYHIPVGTYQNPPEFIIEPDASTATYPMAVAAIMGRAVTIPHLGTRSIQGDAGFACGILQKMGCEVTLTDDTTIVRGPPIGTLTSFGQVDMEPLTDTFLTAACLAAVVQGGGGVSTITGIANQRVKECNRISAMVSQLAKFGVHAEELDDGLKIFGQDYKNLECNGSVHCFDDHRVAMSFSVLGCLVPCILRDRFCTKKTWPEWWDVLGNVLNVDLNLINITETQTMLAAVNSNDAAGDQQQLEESISKDKNVILIGMRGVGKTTIGQAVSKILSKHFVDMDEEFTRVHNTPVNEYIEVNGWETFRVNELQLLHDIITKYPTDCIIATGGGLVETEDGRATLQNLNEDVDKFAVVHVRRNLHKIIHDPSFKTKIAYGEGVSSVWERRRPWFEKLSSAEFYVTDSGVGDTASTEFEETFQQMASFVQACFTGHHGRLSLIFSQTTSPVQPIYSILNNGGESGDPQEVEQKWRLELKQVSNLYKIIELRFVLPENRIDNEEEIRARLEEIGEHYFLRKRISKLPTVLTCTSTEDSFQTSRSNIFIDSLIIAVSKWNVDLLCLDEPIALHLSSTAKEFIAGTPKLRIGTLYSGPDLDTVLGKTKYDIIEKDAKVETGFGSRSAKEIIYIDQNQTPFVSQYLMPAATYSADELITKLRAINMKLAESRKLQSKKFYLFGSPISKSKSPLLHNTGFASVELPYVYQNYEAAQIETVGVEALIKDPEFGGASVTMPLKEKIGEFLDEITDAGRVIGAINTIYRDRDGKLVGDNTDYIGMLKVLESALINVRGQGHDAKELRGMIIGGGGTARSAIYTFLSIPQIKYITIINRSVDKVQTLIQEFKQKPGIRKDAIFEADSLESLNCVCHDDLHHPHFIISTIPANAQSHCKFSKQLFRDTSVVVEMVYGIQTPLLQAVHDFNHAKSPEQTQSHPHVLVCSGAQVLIEQGLKQFEIWTGLTLPFEEMRSVVEKAFEVEK